MTICYFGQFDPEYARNRILIRALREQGVTVDLCRSVGEKRSYRRYPELSSRFLAQSDNVDQLLIGTPGYYDVPVGKLLSKVKRMPVVFDAYASMYDTEVLDRQNVASGSSRALYYRLMDWFSCSLPDTVLVDTEETKEFLRSEIGASSSSIHAIPHGTDERIFYPRDAPDGSNEDEYRVWFHGNHIPLQGIEYIVKAAKLLEDRDVEFYVVGKGQTYGAVSRLIENQDIDNVERFDWIRYEDLPEEIAKSDICLGIFGTSGKSGRVIPNKVYEYIAMGMPVISGDSPAMRRLFDHDENIYLCDRGDPSALADAIETLLDSQERRRDIGEKAYEHYVKNFTTEKVGERLLQVI